MFDDWQEDKVHPELVCKKSKIGLLGPLCLNPVPARSAAMNPARGDRFSPVRQAGGLAANPIIWDQIQDHPFQYNWNAPRD